MCDPTEYRIIKCDKWWKSNAHKFEMNCNTVDEHGRCESTIKHADTGSYAKHYSDNNFDFIHTFRDGYISKEDASIFIKQYVPVNQDRKKFTLQLKGNNNNGNLYCRIDNHKLTCDVDVDVDPPFYFEEHN